MDDYINGEITLILDEGSILQVMLIQLLRLLDP